MTYNPNADDMNNDAQTDLRDGIDQIGDGMNDTTKSQSQGSGMDDLKNKGADMAQNARDTAQDYVERAREMGSEYAGRARSEAERLYQQGQERASELTHYAGERYDEVSEMVRRNPAQALGIAAGVGFLVGLILARR